MKQVLKSYYITRISIVFLLAVGLLLGGCNWFKDDDDSSTPTTPAAAPVGQQSGEFFSYQATQTPGMTISVDFNRHHIAGQPYGTWRMFAVWQTPEGQSVVETTLPVAIDPAGKGSVQLPVEFLNAVFTEAEQDQRLWQQPGGLQISFFPDEATWEYYTFD